MIAPRLRAPLAALAASLGLIGAYLAFGGASYNPAAVADPCQTRPAELLRSRGAIEGIALSALDGAACELGVSREELTLALAQPELIDRFAAAHGIDSDNVTDAVRAGLERAISDAEDAGRIGGLEARLLDEAAERAPIGPLLDALRALPGEVGIAELLAALRELADPDLPDPPGLSDVLPDLLPGS